MGLLLFAGLSALIATTLSQRAPVGFASNPDRWAGHRAAVDPRFPVQHAAYKLTSEGSCGDVGKGNSLEFSE